MSYYTDKLPITIVILTKNEQEVIIDAINSAISDYSEIIIIDSYSNDKTVQIAHEAGVKVVQNEFIGFASQRNYALSQLKISTEWIFFLDADERISQELTLELRDIFSCHIQREVGMFYMRRKDYFQGRWIKHSSGYPTWFGRLCRTGSVYVAREINEEYHCTGTTVRLKSHLIHYPFAKGLSNWLDRHNRYSNSEAMAKAKGEVINYKLIFSNDPGLRRKGLKQIYMRLPFRPLVSFLYLFIIKFGFLDGLQGLRYALLRSFYELMISIKTQELLEKNIQNKTENE